MKKQILVVGSLNMDMVIEMKRMPLQGETVLGENLEYIPGGKGANQAYAAGMLGGNAVMLGCVGKDSLGDRMKENMAQSGADISGIAQVEGYPSGMAVIYVNEEGDNSIVVVSGANRVCSIDYLKENEQLFRDSSYIVFQMEIPYKSVVYGIQKAKEFGKTVILNPAPAPDELPAEVLDGIDYLTPNETEILKLTGRTVMSMENIRAGAEELLRKGVKNVLVTLGDKGALLVNGQGSELYPTRKVDAVDTTAAGDCFNGAFAVGLSEGMSLDEAILFANTSSSIAVTRKGAQSSIPNRNEVEHVLKENIKLCS